MKKISKISASFLTIAALACIFWMGSFLLRLMLSYQLFDKTITAHKDYLNDQNLTAVLITINPAVIATFVLFIAFLTFYFLFLVTSKLSLRKNGWLFIITILILITAPFEIYLMTIDYRIFTDINSGIFNSGEVLSLLMKRLTVLSSFSLIELLCYCAIVFLAIFKPMTRE
jgi:hypothetical protein